MIDEVFRENERTDDKFLKSYHLPDGSRVIDAKSSRIAYVADPKDDRDAINKSWAIKYFKKEKDAVTKLEEEALAKSTELDSKTSEAINTATTALREIRDVVNDFKGRQTELNTLKSNLEALKVSLEKLKIMGVIDDATSNLIQTYSSKKIKELIDSAEATLMAALKQKIDKNDAYTKQETDEKFLKIGDYGLGGLDNMPMLRNIDDTTTPTGFYRAVENQTSGTFPQPYGGSRHAHVLVERVDANWIKQTIVQISQDGTKPIFYRTNNLDRGWHPWKEVVTSDGYNLDMLKEATSNSSSNTLVRRDVNGDFEGRWVIASHFLQKTIAQDTHFDENSEIAFRQQQLIENDPKHIRFVTAKNFAKQISTPLNTANAIVGRDENGDFEGRWITAGHFLMKTKAQDNIFDANSEICFRMQQTSEDSPSHMRFATLAKFKESLGLSRGSVGASGWVGLPKGLILQWGTTQNLGVGEKREIMFPIVFPNWTLSVVATPGLPSPNNGISSLHINGFFKEKFTIQNTDADSTYPAYWIAIGY